MGRVLAEDIEAPVNLPPFDQSAMDGYAIKYTGNLGGINYQVAAEVKAGDHPSRALGAGEAARIFTGAVIPKGADTVVMQEVAIQENGTVKFTDDSYTTGANIRKAGVQIKAGETALTKGSVLTPGAIGLLASLGIASVKVWRLPKVSVIVTGNELQQPGNH